MKTIYLASISRNLLIEDIQKVFPEYDGEIEYSNGSEHLHLIGDIPIAFDDQGNVTEWRGMQHANLYVPDEFDESVLECLRPAPEHPYNKLAL